MVRSSAVLSALSLDFQVCFSFVNLERLSGKAKFFVNGSGYVMNSTEMPSAA